MTAVLAALLLGGSFPGPAWAGDRRLLRERLAGAAIGSHQGMLYGARNTMRAFRQAQQGGADIVELDLRLSKDGVPVVFHDPWLGFWTRCHGRVEDKTAQELKGCRYRFNGEPIAAFEEVLAWSGGKVVVDAEFKTLDVIAPALELVRRRRAYDWVYFQTQWDPAKYYKARSLDKEAALQFQPWTLDRFRWALTRKDENLLVIELTEFNELSYADEHIRAIRAAGKLVSANSWDPAWAKEFFGGANCAWAFKKGIDIVVTNRPAECAAQRDRLRRGGRP